jgi:O-antigen/teichoic acid export membrane protein
MSSMARLAALRQSTGGSTSLVSNSIVIMITTGANLLLGFGFWVIAARTTSVDAVGLASAVIAAMTLASTAGAIGVGNTLIQLLGSTRDPKQWTRTLNGGLVFALICSLACGVVLAVALPFATSSLEPLRRVPILIAFLVGVCVTALGDTTDRAFVANRATERMLVRNVTAGAVRIGLLVVPIALFSGSDLLYVSWVVSVAVTIPLGLRLVRGLQPEYRPAIREGFDEARRLRTTVAGHHAISIGNMAPQYVLPLLVTGILSVGQNAVYFATWRVAGAFFVISVAVATSLFAEISHDHASLHASARRSIKLIGALLVPGILFFALAGREVLGILGPRYEDGYALLMIFIVASVPDAITNVYVSVLRAQRRFGFATVLTCGMAGLAIVLTVVLLGPLGIIGAGIAWSASQVAGCLLVAWDLYRRRGASPPEAAPVAEVAVAA